MTCKQIIAAVEAMFGPVHPGRPVPVPAAYVAHLSSIEKATAAGQAARCGIRWRIVR